MARGHFTVDEVEALIPTLERIFVQVLQLRAGLRALGQKLDRAGVKADRDAVQARAGGDGEMTEAFEVDDGPPAVRQAKAVFRGLDEALTDEVERIHALGGELKDIELGLVDFPSTREGEDILLCWKLGEKSIGYWHAVDGGFASRKPIDAQISSVPSRLDLTDCPVPSVEARFARQAASTRPAAPSRPRRRAIFRAARRRRRAAAGRGARSGRRRAA